MAGPRVGGPAEHHEETTATVVAELASGLATGRVRIVDLTNPLSAQTPTLRLPEPFANLIDFSLERVSEYDEPGPFWKHHNIHTGEHIGTHLDAPIHWVSGRDGDDVSQIPPSRLCGPAAVLDLSERVTQDADFLLTVDDIKQWEADHGPLPDNGWLLFRSGWDRFADIQTDCLRAIRTPLAYRADSRPHWRPS